VPLSSALIPPLSAGEDPAPGARRLRWAFWRSPAGQPAWARPVLLGIAAVAALLYAWNITGAGLAPFYSVAVKSMSESWKAFFYGAIDPKATITIDKLAGSFLPQALSARLFGFHPWSLALPQVIEGVVSVLVMYRAVRRWAGVVPGLLAAAVFTLTPIAASMFGHSMEDGALTMCLVLAADQWQRAVGPARLRSLAWAGAWVGLGFQAKMMQAWMVLPALGLGYLVAAPARPGRRLWHLAAAGAVTLAVSLSWIGLYTLTPAADRPYVDGSTNNSAVAMVFGYNGLERFGITVPGSVASFGGGAARRAGSGPAVGTATATAGDTATAPAGRAGARYNAGGFLGSSGGWTKLAGSRFGPEIGWLYPLALLALVAGLAWRRRAPRTDPVRAGLVMWGAWLLTYALIFSAMGNIPHTAYMASLAPPIAALSGAGIAAFWRWYRAGGWQAWLLPAAVAAELAWSAYLWSSYPGFLPWARTAMILGGLAALAVMVAGRLGRRRWGLLGGAGLAAGAAAMLAAPAAWSASVLDTRYGGSSFDASAGPASGFGPGGGPTARFQPGGGGAGAPGSGGEFPGGEFPGGEFPGGSEPGGGEPPGRAFPGGTGGGAGGGILASASTTLTGTERQLYRYLTAHQDGAGYLLAVQSWSQASPYILATGQEVMPMGGFSGSVPEPTLAQARHLVATGQLRYFLLGAGGGLAGPGGGQAGGTRQAVTSWVESACRTVPARDYGGITSAVGTGGFGAGSAGTLYECGTAAARAGSSG
jgi:4-amino-4-deoxy-L-arabinose transferase-like glycosyltransferase